jgi:hypothetical protein
MNSVGDKSYRESRAVGLYKSSVTQLTCLSIFEPGAAREWQLLGDGRPD